MSLASTYMVDNVVLLVRHPPHAPTVARDGGSIPPVITIKQSGAGYVPEVHRYRHFAIITIRYPLDYPPHVHKRMVTHPAPLFTLILKK